MLRRIFQILSIIIIVFIFLSSSHASTSITISLTKGWNLINIPVQPEETTANNILNNLDYISVWKWENNNWSVLLKNQDTQEYATAKDFSILTSINAGEGFWLNMQTDAQLNVIGNEPASSELYFKQG